MPRWVNRLRRSNGRVWYRHTHPDYPNWDEIAWANDEAEVRRRFGVHGPKLVIEATDLTWAQGYRQYTSEQVPARYVAPEEPRPQPVLDPRTLEAKEYLASYTGTFPFLLDLKNRTGWGLSPKQVDAVLRCKEQEIRRAQAEQARSEAQSRRKITEDGWYKVGDQVYKVQRAVHGSGQLYAKALVVGEHGVAHWEYAPGKVMTLTEDQRLTLEDAQAFGKLYGVCCVCGAALTDERSIANGIGPICGGKLG